MKLDYLAVSGLVLLIFIFFGWVFYRRLRSSKDEKEFINFLVRKANDLNIRTTTEALEFFTEPRNMNSNIFTYCMNSGKTLVIKDISAINKEVIRILKEQSCNQSFK